jgi:CobQ-like glutamine amidotransferase family enzyme
MTDLVVVHLYPRLLRTYGDRGNVLALVRRAEWRGFRVRVEEVGLAEPLPATAGLVLLGGGTDRVQEIVGPDLRRRAGELRRAADRGAVIFGVCGGYQFLGSRYVLPDGRAIEGMGILDVETTASPKRIVGRVHGHGRLWGRPFDLVGFENHGGRTTLGDGVHPLASVPRGQGNDGRDGTEGAVQGTCVGTYLHGPVLAMNPELTDALLARALAPVTGGGPLTPLDDELERKAHDDSARRPREERQPARRRLVAAAIAAALFLGTAGTALAGEIDDDDARQGSPPPAGLVVRPPHPGDRLRGHQSELLEALSPWNDEAQSSGLGLRARTPT